LLAAGTSAVALRVRLDLARPGALSTWLAQSRVITLRSGPASTNSRLTLELPPGTQVSAAQLLRLQLDTTASPPATARFWGCADGEITSPVSIAVVDACAGGTCGT
jgi:hypothetical protein